MVIAHREKYFKTVSKSLWGRQGERGELGEVLLLNKPGRADCWFVLLISSAGCPVPYSLLLLPTFHFLLFSASAVMLHSGADLG